MPNTQPASYPDTKLWNVPNILTMLRIVLAVVVFALFPFARIVESAARGIYLVCLVLFVIAAITDFVDGWWARKYNQKTQFGRIMDPFADKALVCGTFICLVAAPELHNLFPNCASSCPMSKIPFGLATWMVIAIIMREMFVTMLRSMVESSGGDFSAKWIGKWKTGVQCVDLPLGFLILILGGAAAPCWVKALFVILLYVVVYLTLYSGWIYIRAAIGMGKKTNDIPSSEKKG